MLGTLYLVATPIGNLSDITERALQTLRDVDIIACEDTRHTKKLLNHFGISARLVSYYEQNERERSAELGRLLEEGKNIAVVSDAGTPSINDPGFRIVKVAIERGAKVISIPGATAFVSALIVSGLPTDEFYFGGFLPSRKSARRAKLLSVKTIQATLIFYEAPHRLIDSLRDAYEVLGEREAVIARELTKLHEEIVRGRLSELIKDFSKKEIRGEIVLLIGRNEIQTEVKKEKNIAELVAELESKGLDSRSALKQAARELGLTRSEAYRRLQRETA
jgi:16S rRNA (cytidine1402-2'-O)-methyltransferase